jgi:ankyrin repeat protein
MKKIAFLALLSCSMVSGMEPEEPGVISSRSISQLPQLIPPLLLGAYMGDTNMVRNALRNGASIRDTRDSQGRTAAHIAAQFGHTDILNLLGQARQAQIGRLIDNEGNTPVHTAAQYGQGNVITFFVGHGPVSFNAQNRLGYTPLHYAVENDHPAIVEKLLSIPGVKPDIADRQGRTPIQLSRNPSTIAPFIHRGIYPIRTSELLKFIGK